jgi:hypothetical protein
MPGLAAKAKAAYAYADALYEEVILEDEISILEEEISAAALAFTAVADGLASTAVPADFAYAFAPGASVTGVTQSDFAIAAAPGDFATAAAPGDFATASPFTVEGGQANPSLTLAYGIPEGVQQVSGWVWANGTLYSVGLNDDGQLSISVFSGPLPLEIQEQIDAAQTEANTSAPTPPSSAPATGDDRLLNLAMQQAVQEAPGSYDPNPVTPESNISDVLAGSDWASLLHPQFSSVEPTPAAPAPNISDVLPESDLEPDYLTPQFSSPAPVSNDQPSPIIQVLSQTYAESILRTQLLNQGQVPGSFVSPLPPYDYLFSPNASSLSEAVLLSTHSPNADLESALVQQQFAAGLPVIGSVSTWLNPRSGPVSKGIATVGAILPFAGVFAGELGTLGPELETLGTEVTTVGPELETLGTEATTVQDVADLLQELREAGVEVISVKGAREWTQTEIEALIKYREVYQATGSYTTAGDAFHEVVGAASGGTTGPDRVIFNFVNEIKTSAGHPELRDFIKALNEADSHVGIGGYDGSVVTMYDVLNGVKYFVQWR